MKGKYTIPKLNFEKTVDLEVEYNKETKQMQLIVEDIHNQIAEKINEWLKSHGVTNDKELNDLNGFKIDRSQNGYALYQNGIKIDEIAISFKIVREDI